MMYILDASYKSPYNRAFNIFFYFIRIDQEISHFTITYKADLKKKK